MSPAGSPPRQAGSPTAAPAGWNDYDSIEVGNGSNDGLTTAERQTQLSLWSLASAPLILGTDLTSLDPGDLALLENSAVTAVDQDGIPGDRVISSGSEQVFDKRQQNGTWDIGVFNTDASASHSFSVPLGQLGLSGAVNVTSLWSGASLGTVTGTFTTTVPAGGVTLISAAPPPGRAGPGSWSAASRASAWTPGAAARARAVRVLPGYRGADLAVPRRDQPGVLAHVGR